MWEPEAGIDLRVEIRKKVRTCSDYPDHFLVPTTPVSHLSSAAGPTGLSAHVTVRTTRTVHHQWSRNYSNIRMFLLS